MEKEQEIILKIKLLHQVTDQLYEGKESQKRILIVLYEHPQMTQKELTAYLGIQSGSLCEVLKKLMNQDLVVREADNMDLRTKKLKLTQEGEMKAKEALKLREQRHSEMFSCLNEQEKKQLIALLGKVEEDWKIRYKGGKK